MILVMCWVYVSEYIWFSCATVNQNLFYLSKRQSSYVYLCFFKNKNELFDPKIKMILWSDTGWHLVVGTSHKFLV
jgi:hypothetical protein